MHEHTWPVFTDGAADGARSLTAMRVDRHKLVEIAADEAVLTAMLRISYKTNGIRNTNELLACLIDLVFELIPAQRAAILLLGYKPDDFVSATYSPRALGISAAIARQVLRDRVAVSGNGADSLMCAPLRVFDQRLGGIHVECTTSGA